MKYPNGRRAMEGSDKIKGVLDGSIDPQEISGDKNSIPWLRGYMEEMLWKRWGLSLQSNHLRAALKQLMEMAE